MVRHLRVLFDDDEFDWIESRKRGDEDWRDTILREFGDGDETGPPEDWENNG